jgi:hypothetical protein
LVAARFGRCANLIAAQIEDLIASQIAEGIKFLKGTNS